MESNSKIDSNMMHFTRFIRTFAALDTSINERDNDLYNKNPLGKSGCYMLLPRGYFYGY